MSRVVIAGGTGFLGQALVRALSADGHQPLVLSAATPPASRAVWTPDGTAAGDWAAAIDGADAVVNLAGESIAGRRWSPAHKQRILDSRVLAARSLAAAVAAAASPPRVFISGSAVGYYGPRGAEPITEDEPAGADFLARVCAAWEAEALRAADRTRVVRLRTGLVLARHGGALPPMLPPFWFGVGGRVGSGRQYWPWIHQRDWVDLVRFLIRKDALSGPVNATAPEPVTNAAFARALGRAMRRPSFMPAPGFALELLLGEMAGPLLLSGQRAVPAKAQSSGFRYTFPDLGGALRELFATKPSRDG
jgi:uncharacterized protein (TIGR01777 family)